MKRFITRAVSLLMILVLVFTTAPMAFAADRNENATIVGTQNKEGVIGRLTIFSAKKVFPFTGHTWVYIENLTNKPLVVGYYGNQELGEPMYFKDKLVTGVPPVSKNGTVYGVSVGVFFDSVLEGDGIYYNLEAYREHDQKDNYVALTCEITRDDLDRINQVMYNYINGWSFFYNCTYFACKVWNAVPGNPEVTPFFLPGVTYNSVKRKAGSVSGANAYYMNHSGYGEKGTLNGNVWRQYGEQYWGYLDHVSVETLTHVGKF